MIETLRMIFVRRSLLKPSFHTMTSGQYSATRLSRLVYSKKLFFFIKTIHPFFSVILTFGRSWILARNRHDCGTFRWQCAWCWSCFLVFTLFNTFWFQFSLRCESAFLFLLPRRNQAILLRLCSSVLVASFTCWSTAIQTFDDASTAFEDFRAD